MINSLNNKDYIFDEVTEKEYNPWIVNRSLGSSSELLYHVEQINSHSELSKKMQYDYYFYSIPKAKRFKKWIKTNEKSSNYKYIEEISKYFKCSIRKAETAWSIMSDDQRDKMKDIFFVNELKTPKK